MVLMDFDSSLSSTAVFFSSSVLLVIPLKKLYLKYFFAGDVFASFGTSGSQGVRIKGIVCK